MMDSMDPLIALADNFEEQLCSKNSSLRRTLLEQSKCMFKMARNNKPCMKDLMMSLEFVLTGGFNSSMTSQLGCCIYTQTSECNKKVAIEHCGAEAAESLYNWAEEMHARLGFKIFGNRCKSLLEEKKDLCSVLPSPGTSWEKPKNRKGKSILAKLVKQYNSFSQM